MLALQHHYTSRQNLNSALMMSMHTGAGIEFRTHLTRDDDESDVTSPPLWKTSSTTTPTEATPVLDHDRPCRSSSSHRHDYHHHDPDPDPNPNPNPNPNQEHEYYYLDVVVHSPASRAKAISRGQRELMDMVKTMPESAYELSLQDLVQSSSSSSAAAAVEAGNDHELHYNQMRQNNDHKTSTTKKKSTNKKVERLRKSTSMESTNNGSFLLKMFFPISSLGYQKNKKKKTKSSIVTTTTTTTTTTGTRSKVSPRPPLVLEGNTSIIEKENWWRKKFSVSLRQSISNNGGSGHMDGSNSCSSSRNSSRSFSRNMGDFISFCWSTKTRRKKNKPKEQKGS